MIFAPIDRMPALACQEGKRFESKFSGEVLNDSEGIKSLQPIKPEYSVGTRPEPEYARLPEVRLRNGDDREKKAESRSGRVARIKNYLSS